MNGPLRHLVLAGLVIGLGLGFPLVFHVVGGGNLGPVFLPMFLPLVAGAFFLPVPLAAFAGAATPLLSALATGMPPLAPPIAFLMAGELLAFAAVVSVAYRVFQWNVWFSLAAGVIVDRLILAILAGGLASAFGLPPVMVTWSSLLFGLPGIALQFVVIPPLVKRLRSNEAARDV